MSEDTSPNNFDFLRLVTAYLVLFSHHFQLTGHAEPIVGFQGLGLLRVLIFFSISGYLVAQSWERDSSVWRFLAKRILRIWPGLIVVTLITALLLGPSVSTLPLKDYFLASQTWEFFQTLKLSIRHTLPGVFIDNPSSGIVSGTLWSLRVEFRWYLILLALGAIGLLRRRSLLLTGTIVFAVFVFAIQDPQHNPPRSHNFPLGAFFFYGACLHYFRDFWSTRPKLVLSVFGLISAFLFAIDYKYAALFLMVPILVIFFGSASTPFIRRAGRFGDFSFGIYIYAFPVQQTVVMLTSNQPSMWVTLIISTIITLVLAILSWHLVERPALRLKRHLRRTGEHHIPLDAEVPKQFKCMEDVNLLSDKTAQYSRRLRPADTV